MMKESISPEYGGNEKVLSNDDNTMRHRRREAQHQHQHQHQHQPNQYVHQNNQYLHQYEKDQYSHPPLHSQTYGGYGPIPQENDLTECKKENITIIRRIVLFWMEQTKRFGCSSYEMLKSEGENGEYYRDEFNDESWTCSFGTEEESGIWMNASDKSGTIMAFLVWFLISYSAITIQLLSQQGGIPPFTSMLYSYFCCMALASHAKTTFTDPGAVPQSAVPQESVRHSNVNHSMCSQCQTFKPPMSHHCRICNRCVSRMDHHCPWMNNCVGAGNLKHFILFLLYTWICSAFSMLLLCWSYFFCVTDECHYRILLIELVCVMMILSFSAFIFTSSMLMNVCYGLMTGIGTIDRLKKKAQNTMSESMEEPIHLRDVFGIAGYHTWPFPVDPVFEDYDRVMGYSTPQRLLREQLRKNTNTNANTSMDNDFYPPSEF